MKIAHNVNMQQPLYSVRLASTRFTEESCGCVVGTGQMSLQRTDNSS